MRTSRCKLRRIGREVLRFLTIEALARGKRDPVLYLIKPPKANGASVTGSLTHSLGGPFIHVSLKKMHSRTRVHNRHGACMKTVPKEVTGKVHATNIGGPMLLLSRVSGMDASCGKSAFSTLLRMLSDRRGDGFHSRCLRIPLSLSRIAFVAATGALRAVPEPLLSEVRVVRVADCARGRGLRVTVRRLVPGRLRGRKVATRRLDFDGGTV